MASRSAGDARSDLQRKGQVMADATRQLGYRYIFENRTFGLLWASQAVSTLGDVMYDVALLWYVLEATGSALATGGVAVGATAGRLLGGISASAILDRFPVRRIMLGADLLRFVITLALSVAWLGGQAPPLPVLYTLALVLSFVGSFFSPARSAAVPQIVPREHLLHANALDAVSNSIVQTLALMASGVLVATIGPALALLADAGTFLASSILVRAARWSYTPDAAREMTSPLREAFGGLVYVRRERLVQIVVVMETLHALAAGFFVAALPAYIQELGGGAALYGAQGGIFGIGLLLASSLISHTAIRRIGMLYALGVAVNGIGNTLFSLSPSPGWLLPTVFVAGVGWPAWATGKQSMVQAHVQAHVRGRVFALRYPRCDDADPRVRRRRLDGRPSRRAGSRSQPPCCMWGSDCFCWLSSGYVPSCSIPSPRRSPSRPEHSTVVSTRHQR